MKKFVLFRKGIIKGTALILTMGALGGLFGCSSAEAAEITPSEAPTTTATFAPTPSPTEVPTPTPIPTPKVYNDNELIEMFGLYEDTLDEVFDISSATVMEIRINDVKYYVLTENNDNGKDCFIYYYPIDMKNEKANNEMFSIPLDIGTNFIESHFTDIDTFEHPATPESCEAKPIADSLVGSTIIVEDMYLLVNFRAKLESEGYTIKDSEYTAAMEGTEAIGGIAPRRDVLLYFTSIAPMDKVLTYDMLCQYKDMTESTPHVK